MNLECYRPVLSCSKTSLYCTVGIPNEDAGVVCNLLLPTQFQNSAWLQLTSVTLVEFEIVHNWLSYKMNDPGLSQMAFSNILSTLWGCDSRLRSGQKRPFNMMPIKQTTRDTTAIDNQGPRWVISEKRLSHAITLGSIIIVLNEDGATHK